MNVELYPHQLDALKRMHNGCILYGGVGCGKSRTAIAYTYICELGGSLKINGKGEYTKPETPKDLYIITTARKRDTLEWDAEVAYFCLPRSIKVTVDSWNNIKKYSNVYGAMFIFDEQRVVGSGAWVKAFLKISKRNHWILLSATPGDTWQEYRPVFIANGFYKNKTDFNNQHIVWKPYISKFPAIDHYINEKKLRWCASQVLVKVNYHHDIIKHKDWFTCGYDKDKYKLTMKNRWDPYEECPIEEVGKLCYVLRKISNDHESRITKLDEICKEKQKLIVFYNFTYELIKLRKFFQERGFKIGEWNGELHTPVPTGKKWVYLCQYTAACEGWNCISTDTIVFFSQNYSYKVLAQAEGRIDRLTTPYSELYYYYLKSNSPIDIGIKRALEQKHNFNEKIFMKGVSC